MNINSNVSYYINPNSKSLTSNINNTKIMDNDAFASIQQTLRPVEDIETVWR